MRKVLVCLFALCFALLSTAGFAMRQETFYLKVLVEDARTGRPVQHARVEADHVLHQSGTRISESTDSRGQVCVGRTFNLRAKGGHSFPLTYGTNGFSARVTISRSGYETVTKNVMFHLPKYSQLEIVRLQPQGHSGGRSSPGIGYASSSAPIMLPAVPPRGFEDSAPRKFQESAITGKLVIISDPLGAVVYIDGERTSSKTPLKVEIQAGHHEVTLRYEGAKVIKAVKVPMEDKVVLRVNLRKALAKIEQEQKRQRQEQEQKRKQEERKKAEAARLEAERKAEAARLEAERKAEAKRQLLIKKKREEETLRRLQAEKKRSAMKISKAIGFNAEIVGKVIDYDSDWGFITIQKEGVFHKGDKLFIVKQNNFMPCEASRVKTQRASLTTKMKIDKSVLGKLVVKKK